LHFLALIVASQAFALTAPDQGPTPARILERRLRLTRDAGGGYRVIESLLVRVETDSEVPEPSEPIPLVRLQEGAEGVRGLGGDVAARQVIIFAPLVALNGPLPRREIRLAFTYLLPASASSLVVAAESEVGSLIVEVDKGGLDVRPDPALRRDADGGAPTRPHRTYQIDDLAPNAAFTFEFITSRVDARQRFAVLFLTAFLGLAAAVWVWRRT
jgi:hypothetical protein